MLAQGEKASSTGGAGPETCCGGVWDPCAGVLDPSGITREGCDTQAARLA